MTRRKSLAPVASPPSRERPRDLVARTGETEAAPRYPRIGDLAPGDLAAAVRAFARIAACAGLVVAATATTGCEDPQCGGSRLDELKSHGGSAASLLFDLHPIEAGKELGTGMGIVPHPIGAAIAGEAPAVVPALPAPTTTPKP